MKKWLVLCIIFFTAVYAKDASLEHLNELMADLDAIVDAKDGNDTIGELLSGMDEFEDEGDVVGVEQEENELESFDMQEPEDEQEDVFEGADDDTIEEFIGESQEEAEPVTQESDEQEIVEEFDGESEGEDASRLISELDRVFSEEVEAPLEDESFDFDESQPIDEDDDDNGDAIETGFLREDGTQKDIADPVQEVENFTFDIKKKRDAVVELVDRAKQELEERPLDVACNRFTHTKEFIKGDLYVFVYDINGTCLAHGEDAYLLWRNMYDFTDWVGTPAIQNMIQVAKEGGGWVTYEWHNATKVTYVQLVEKEGKAFVVGSGFFPHSKKEAVVNLVKGGVALFDKIKNEGKPADRVFSLLSYPGGSFVTGNLYLYALDFSGNIMAQGDRPGLIGSNAWNYKDENGVYVNREIVKKLKASSEGVWVEYTSKRALKKTYAEKVKAKNGKEYFIACGYYPEANREQTMDLVRSAYQFMKTTGKTSAIEEFSHRRSDAFRYGDLYITVYDMKGKIIADGGNVDNIGQSVLNETDEDGFEYIKSMLKRATKQGIWVNAKLKGSFQSTFAQHIDIGVGQYVIASSYYPISKTETMILLVQSGASYLKANPREKAFEKFVKKSGQFRRGDLELVVVDTTGLCYAYGDDYDLIWRNIYNLKDEKGKQFIRDFIQESEHGSIHIKTHLNGATKHNFVTSLKKEGKTYVISSGFYQ